jgi:tetratricopeptide (TPR) repeat protein
MAASPSRRTLNILFAKSGNRCAFPDCPSRLIDEESVLLGRVCHIEAASKRGPRYNPTQSNEERHHFDNLIVLCPHHHIIIDTKPETYSVTWLKKVKADHEARQMRSGFTINPEALDSIRDVIRDEFSRRGQQNDESIEADSSGLGFRESIEHIHENVNNPPKEKSAESYFQLGLSHQLKKNLHDAAESYELAISLDDDHWQAKINLGNVYMSEGQFQQAQDLYNQVLKKDKDNYAALVNSGFIIAREGNLAKSIDYFMRASQSDPTRFEAWFNLGNTCLDVNDITEAIKNYKKTLQINPTYFLALTGLAEAYHRIGDYENSIEEYLKALKVNDSDSETFISLGRVYSKKYGVQQALPYYLAAIERNPNDFFCWFNLGSKYREIRAFNKAIECYEKASRLPSIINYKDYRYDLYINLGTAYSQSGNESAAIVSYKLATEIRPDSFDAWLSLCMAYARSGNIPLAKETYGKILIINPTYQGLIGFLRQIGSSGT